MNKVSEDIKVPEILATIPMPGTQKGQAVLFKDHSWAPIIAGGDGEGGEEGEEGVPAGESAVTEGTVPAAAAAAEGTVPAEGGAEEPIIEIGGEQFTASQIQDALHIQQNQADFTTKNQQEAERLNVLSGVIEQARLGLTSQPANTPSVKSETPSIQTAEQFRDALLSDNPTEAITYLVNHINESVGKHTTENDAKNAFMTAHPDYLQVIASPGYKNFLAQSPLGQHLNDVNGYYEYKASTTGDETKAAENKGFKAGEETALANLKAKGGLKLLNGGGGVTPPSKTQITPASSRGEVMDAATQALIDSRAG